MKKWSKVGLSSKCLVKKEAIPVWSPTAIVVANQNSRKESPLCALVASLGLANPAVWEERDDLKLTSI